MARDVRVAILGDSRDFSRAVKSANDDAGRLEKAFGRAGSGIASIGKAAAIGAAGIAVGAAALGKGFVEAAIESQKVTAQTDAVIKSMGNASNVSARQIADLSTKLSLKTGIDDELIQSGSNVLLTFGKIRNEVGKGNDIFDRANAAALDMSVALGTDMKSASMQVGKALNDPIRGLTQLRRSGIQFTKQQEDQVKAMVAAGDVAGAQKVMLAELEKQFGGSAAAQATATDKLKVAWGNLQEQLGAKLLPVVEKVATFLAENLPKTMERLGPVLARMSAWFKQAFDQVNAKVQEWWPKIVAAFQEVVAVVRKVWPDIQNIISQVVTTVASIVSGVVSVITTVWENFGNNILEFVQRVWPSIRQVIKAAMDIIQGVIKTITSLIKGDWSGVWEGIKQTFSGVWNAIQGIVKAALEVLRTVIGAALEVLGSIIKSAWNGIVDFFAGLPGRISSIASGMFDGIKNAFKSAINWIIRAWNGLEFKIPGFDPPGPGPKFGGFTLGVPNIPVLHKGTSFFNPPGGGREGLALLERGERVTPRGGGGNNYSIVVQALDPKQAGPLVVEAIHNYERSNGSGWRS